MNGTIWGIRYLLYTVYVHTHIYALTHITEPMDYDSKIAEKVLSNFSIKSLEELF